MLKMKHALLLSMGALAFLGCSDDNDDAPENEEELITTVQITLTEIGGADVRTFVFRDTDGEGGQAPSRFDEIELPAGKAYNCAITLLNESVTPAEDITEEVSEEADDHQFYFEPTNNVIFVSNQNLDSKGYPLGVTSRWATSDNPATGTLKLTLKHKPGIKGPNDAVSVGETDIELTWNVEIQ